jgi:hypothetical protein
MRPSVASITPSAPRLDTTTLAVGVGAVAAVAVALS